MRPSIGIDLGTTNSAVATATTPQPQIIERATGQRLFAYAGIVTLGPGAIVIDGNRVYRAGTNIAVGYPVPIPVGATSALTTVTGNLTLAPRTDVIPPDAPRIAHALDDRAARRTSWFRSTVDRS